ncbi:hypothetical protein BJX68DRAFT_223469 [Aspergillus pseudodeflectus]|uniref:Fungal-type protein kinase domain-containing protein n=1 Tax=Aspergillus pseudodeflectus TaxID=176178 RepID=A0ABR4LBI5_9EURO
MGKDRSFSHSRKRRRTESEAEPEPSDYLQCALEDCRLALTPTDQADRDFTMPAQPRVDVILHLALAQVKKKLQTKYTLDKLKTIFWSYEQVIALETPGNGGDNVLDCALDYVLWYGNRRNLETNCVVICAEEPIASEEQYLPLVAAMAIIQNNRVERGVNKGTFGIVTDGFKWVFIHLNSKNKYSPLVLNWADGQEQAIVNTIDTILETAATMRPLYDQSPGDWRKGSSIWDWKQWSALYDEGEVTSKANSPSNPQYSMHRVPSLSFLPPTDTSNHASSFRYCKMAWFSKIHNKWKDSAKRQKKSKHSKKTDDTSSLAASVDDKTGKTRGKKTPSKPTTSTEQAAEKPAPESATKLSDKGAAKPAAKPAPKSTAKPVQKKLPSKAVTDLSDVDVEDMFGLTFAENHGDIWHLDVSDRRAIPDHLRATLSDYDLVFGKGDRNEAVCRARLNVILFTILAAKKKEEFGQYGRGKGANKRVSTESNASYKPLHWGLETSLSYPWTHDNTPKLLRGRMDYCLWYGNHKDAETNIVVVEAKRSHNSMEGLNQVLSYLSMIMHARKKASRTSSLLYGIATDSLFWTFIRLDTQGKVSTHTLSWRDGQQIEIVSHLHRIMQRAATLSPVQSYSLSREPTVEEATGLDLSSEHDY